MADVMDKTKSWVLDGRNETCDLLKAGQGGPAGPTFSRANPNEPRDFQTQAGGPADPPCQVLSVSIRRCLHGLQKLI
jgi:hypothetical protein